MWLAHELRTPIQPILTLSEFLLFRKTEETVVRGPV